MPPVGNCRFRRVGGLALLLALACFVLAAVFARAADFARGAPPGKGGKGGGAKGSLADRLRETAQGLSHLAEGFGKAFDETVVIALGEFGRGARENRFGGKDNGQGGVMCFLGGPVAGGQVLGEWPGLAAHRLAGGRDMTVATDWRDVAAQIAVRHLGLPEKRLADVFSGFSPAGAPQVLG